MKTSSLWNVIKYQNDYQKVNYMLSVYQMETEKKNRNTSTENQELKQSKWFKVKFCINLFAELLTFLDVDQPRYANKSITGR